jgi:hypothetical protein
VQLTDYYFALRDYVPKSHRNRINPNDHLCIFHVFEEGYHSLKMAEASLKLLAAATPPAPQQEVIYAPMILGEED